MVWTSDGWATITREDDETEATLIERTDKVQLLAISTEQENEERRLIT